ncbi:MAG: NAD(P)/FAD-dependent oxidoreductase [Nocardioides sp.]
MTERVEHLDVVIIGAGLSGIGAAARLRAEHPFKSVALLEARTATGGTWDLFRYPGVRSDSDMYTLGFRFRPWRGERSLAAGSDIVRYLRETAAEHGVEPLIRLQHRVISAAWDSAAARWTLTVRTPAGEQTITCTLLWSCAGYYDYSGGHRPVWAGEERYGGRIVHPQEWPADVDYAGQRVAVIGSGATAVTLVPAMAASAAHVTMVQRSPSYVVTLPGRDRLAERLRARLPARAAYRLIRGKGIALSALGYRLSRRFPERVKRVLVDGVRRQLPPGYDVDRDFTPTYRPWDQRVCFVPDGDLFAALSSGRASVVTGEIERFTERGLRMRDGTDVAADLVVTATGLRLLPFGGVPLTVDGAQVVLPETVAYRALMLGGVPNFVFTVGYTNASWTLKADLVADYVCRLLTELDSRDERAVVPVPDPRVRRSPFMEFESGYVQRALGLLPQQGDRPPWRLRQNYLADRRTLRRAPIDDGTLRFFA